MTSLGPHHTTYSLEVPTAVISQKYGIACQPVMSPTMSVVCRHPRHTSRQCVCAFCSLVASLRFKCSLVFVLIRGFLTIIRSENRVSCACDIVDKWWCIFLWTGQYCSAVQWRSRSTRTKNSRTAMRMFSSSRWAYDHIGGRISNFPMDLYMGLTTMQRLWS